jgi:hypothetical protein
MLAATNFYLCSRQSAGLGLLLANCSLMQTVDDPGESKATIQALRGHSNPSMWKLNAVFVCKSLEFVFEKLHTEELCDISS